MHIKENTWELKIMIQLPAYSWAFHWDPDSRIPVGINKLSSKKAEEQSQKFSVGGDNRSSASFDLNLEDASKVWAMDSPVWN